MAKLKRNIDGKSFLYDGIEDVKLFRIVDGDSSFFQTSGGNINVRFYGINAPETTKKIEPFGIEAREFAYSKLANAYRIVIESDGDVPILDLTEKRFMAYVWYQANEGDDFVLFNEEILKIGLANLLLYDNVTKYREILIEASKIAEKNKLNLYSEELFNKKKEPFKGNTKLTITEILENIDSYCDGRTIQTSGIISLLVGKSFFLEEHCNNKIKGIYVYNSYYNVDKLNIGDEIRFSCQVSNDITFGKQLINIRGVEVISKNNKIDYVDVETEEEVLANIGRVVRLKEVKVFQKANCNKKFNSFYLKVILPFGDPLNIKTFKETINAPSFASVIQHKDYDAVGGLVLYTSDIEEGPKPWLILGNDSKKTFVKLNNN